MASLRQAVSLLCVLIVTCEAQRKFSEITGGNKTMRCNSPFGTADVSFTWLTTTLEHTTPFILFPGLVDEAKYNVTSGVTLSLCGGSNPCLQCASPAQCYVEVRVLDLEVKDSGTYTCQTQNLDNREKKEENFEINVLDKPNAIYLTKKSDDGSPAERFDFNVTHQVNVPVIRNNHVSINFTVENSYPSAKISCTASEPLEEKVEIVDGNEQFTKTVTQTIEFTAVKSLQIIRCQLDLQHDSYPVVTYDINIDVQYPPLGPVNFDVREPEPTSTDATTGLKTYEVQVDQVLKFTCSIPEQGNPKGKVGLVRDGSQDQINGRVVEKENDIIEFTVDSYDQTGMYRCSVQNYLAHELAPQNQKIEIKVIGATTITHSDKSIAIVEGANVTFYVVACGNNDLNPSAVWTHNGNPVVEPFSTWHLAVESQETIIDSEDLSPDCIGQTVAYFASLPHVTTAGAGDYTFTLEQDVILNDTSLVEMFTLIVYPADVFDESDVEVAGVSNGTVQIHIVICSHRPFTNGHSQWHLPSSVTVSFGNTVPGDERIYASVWEELDMPGGGCTFNKMTTLDIRQLRASDSGNYTLDINNQDVTSTHTVVLTVYRM